MNLTFLINESAGGLYRSHAFKRTVEEFCNGLKIHYEFRGELDPSTFGPCSVLVCCGGDGTVSRLIDQLAEMETPPPFCVVPLGTGNDFARSTGWYGVWKAWGMNGLISGIRAAKCRSLDIWSIESRHEGKFQKRFCAYLGIGADGAVLGEYQRICRLLKCVTIFPWQKRAYHALSAIIYLLKSVPLLSGHKCHTLRVRSMDSKGAQLKTSIEITQRGCVLFSNIKHYLGGLKVLAEASFDDGKVDVVSLKGLFSMAIRGHLVRDEGVSGHVEHMGQYEKIEIFLKEAISFEADGEPLGGLRPGVYTIQLNRSVPILIPPRFLLGEVGVRPLEAMEKKRAGKIFVPEPSFY